MRSETANAVWILSSLANNIHKVIVKVGEITTNIIPKGPATNTLSRSLHPRFQQPLCILTTGQNGEEIVN